MYTIHRGNAAEAAVLQQFVAAGVHVLVPFGGGLQFDLGAVVPPEGRFVKVQVKSGRIREGCVECNSCSTDHGEGRLPYRGRADVFAVHVPDLDDVLVIPVDDCASYRGYLRIDPPRNNQRSGVRFARDYSLEAWRAFRSRLQP